MVASNSGCLPVLTAASVNQGETTMFRKFTLALAAAAVVATAAIPTTASASHWRDGWRHHHRHHHGASVRYSTPYYAYASGPYYGYRSYCFTKNRWVHTHWGWRMQRVRVCR
jgi:hypothetical protein